MPSERGSSQCAIAIVGCAGRFPGARDVAAFWQNLCAGVESIRTFTDSELEDAFAPGVRARPDYVKARSVLGGVADFDAAFFGMHAREAELTDPQHRFFLECSWEALEDAGYDPATFAGTIGVFAGCSFGSYFLRNVLGGRDAIERFTSDYQVASYPELLGAGYDFLATRVAYKLDLRGPAMTLQSACSTSLLAVTQACQALMLRQADMMLAGGVSISFPQKRGYLYQEGGMVSPDAHCRTFDALANGTVFGDGAGVVVLRRLEDALADHDSIYAVIRGFGVNNDGSGKVGYTAPSVQGQASAVRAAHAMAGFEPSTIGFVECHGTATPLGDPIEFAALSKAFGPSANGKSCALGSVKTNVGHLDVASGVTGLIKAALTIRHGKIPPTLHFKTPNPNIDLAASPFFVNTELAEWPTHGLQRRAAVSSFGVGGTNVHVALEAAPSSSSRAASDAPQLIVLSARTESALKDARARLAAHLRASAGERLDDVAHTLQAGRRAFPVRCAVIARSPAAAADALERPERLTFGRAGEREPSVAFMFPGQGAQYPGMGRELYDGVATFRASVDRCADILQPILGRDLRALLRGDGDPEELASTDIAQPALFTIEFALAELLRSYGIACAATVGHSVGEFVAACLAGVFSVEDALALVAERGRLMRALPAGAMIAVRAPASAFEPLLDAGLDIAARNAPGLAVVSGAADAIDRFERRLNGAGIACRRLHTSHAFHSSMMDPMIAPFARHIGAVRLSPPSAPYVSSLTGTWIATEEATSPQYWARHCREPVRFADALQTLVEAGVDALVEVGPGTTLATFALQGAAKGGRPAVLGTLPGSDREHNDLEGVLQAVGRLWIAGARPNWQALGSGTVRSRISLPAYPFERSRHWIEPSNVASQQRLEPNLAALTLPETDRTHRRDAQQTVAAPSRPSRATRVQTDLRTLLEELSGESLAGTDPRATFLELGFDSLALGRFVAQVQSQFGVGVTFRQLLTEIPSIAALTDHVVPQLPPEPQIAVTEAVATALRPQPAIGPSAGAETTIEIVMREQLEAMQQLMREQLEALKGLQIAPATTSPIGTAPLPAAATAAPEAAESETSTRLDAFRVMSAAKAEVTPAQRAHIEELVARTVARTQESKRLTQRYRRVLADPRVAAGFRSEWKEMVYPITCVRAKGSRIWDADGNEYIDLLNGFGQTAFGHAPDFVVDAVAAQLQRGFAIGPQTELAGEVAELFCELTGNERATFCNTGSEAVMAALRVARTVTNRERVVVFEGAYHGQFDEVLVKSARTSRRSLPVALGIPAEAVANITVLPYGESESLEWVREHQNELAAVVVESVQSRHPALRPKEFLAELRRITEASGTAFVFDEVVTGFRMHPGGMQEIFGIRADLGTYGKVVGGGLPIGILAGKARFMDALDGGMWQYGDDSFPQVAPTFLAGTFVRHPLAMAAVLAVLRHVKAEGPALQELLARRTAALVARLNAELESRGIESRIETYGSLFYMNFAAEDRLASLLYYHLRLRGIYVQEGFPSFIGTEHTDADIDAIVAAFSQSLGELQGVGILADASREPIAAVTAPDEVPLDEVPLTEEQTEIWLSAQVSDEASCAFNESVTLRLRGPLDGPSFQDAWNRIVARHDALRASFGVTGESMRITPPRPLAFLHTDVAQGSPSEREAALREIVHTDARTAFDLARGPVVRAHLVRLASDEHAFVFTAHHIVCDGWSMNVILSELAEIYRALSQGREPELLEALAFASYARRQTLRDPGEIARIESYWLEEFAHTPPLLELPTDRPRPAIKTYNGDTRTTTVNGDCYRAIKKAGARHGCTLFVTLLAAFDLLVGRLADQDDVVVGVPAAGQALLEGDILVGHCVDFLPIRTRQSPQMTIGGFLVDVKRRVLDAYEHQQYTLGTLVRKLALEREKGRVPLAEIQFNLERFADGLNFGSIEATVVPNPKAFVNFDLFLNVVESSDGLRVDCDYNTDLFDSATIDRWLGYFRALLDEIVRDGAQAAARVDFRPDDERRLLSAINDTAAEYPREQTVHGLFRAMAATRPDALAVRFGDEAISYGALARRVNQAANYLSGRIGGPGQRVAVCLDRSPDLLVALLATLSSGHSYVPLDPAHPPARLRRIVEDARVAALICDGSIGASSIPSGVEVIDLRGAAGAISRASDADPQALAPAPDAAYVIYTSGSTGEPKGVEVTHRSVVNLLTSMSRKPGLAANDVLFAVTTISFDIAALELFLPLVVGATVALASREDLTDGITIVQRMRSVGATSMQATPALWQALLDAGFRSHPSFTMLCGGESLPRELANRLLAGGGELWNVYGPTETTIWSSCAKIERGQESISIGTPVANTQLYVLDRADRPALLGAIGQLHIAGDGLARGYVNQPALTDRKFVPNPFGPGRMYRTGDLARVSSDGRVQVLGRIDHQVKLRGFRIELGEIENVLRHKADFAETVVMLREDLPGEPRLVCYYVDPKESAHDPASLRTLAAENLPDYMIPSAWVKLARMPLSVAGKVDRAALPAPDPLPCQSHFRSPETPTQTTLARIWGDVLHLERVGLDDDFFALGGDSIHLFQITARANQNGLRLAAKELLRHPTIAALARRLDEVAPPLQERAVPVSPISIARIAPLEDSPRRSKGVLRITEHS